MYKNDKTTKIVCNKCGRELSGEPELLREGVCSVRVEWGYFSRKDGETHQFHLCEDCYDALVKSFRIPVRIRERTELL